MPELHPAAPAEDSGTVVGVLVLIVIVAGYFIMDAAVGTVLLLGLLLVGWLVVQGRNSQDPGVATPKTAAGLSKAVTDAVIEDVIQNQSEEYC
jgi:hypothetical protein